MFIKKIETITNYHFRNRDLLLRALTRKTYSEENGGENNESLEFVGDSFLNCAVTIALIERYGISKNDPRWIELSKTNQAFFKNKEVEEALSQIRSTLVCKLYLANRATEHKLHHHIRMGCGDIKQHLERQESVKEDLLEAIIGAIAIDSNYDMHTVVDVVEKLLYIDRAMARSEYDIKGRTLCHLRKKTIRTKRK